MNVAALGRGRGRARPRAQIGTQMVRMAGLALACLGLAACGDTPLGRTLGAAQGVLSPTPPPSQFTASRQELIAAGITGPLVKVVQENPAPASAGYLATGASGGTVFYRANDGSEVQMAAGLLVRTVSFQHDLLGADVAPIAAALVAGGGQYTRALRHIRAANHVVTTTYSCTLTPTAQEAITVQGQSYDTVRFTETCTAAADALGRVATFTNRYWLDSSGVRAGDHWVSPEVGSLRIEQVFP